MSKLPIMEVTDPEAKTKCSNCEFGVLGDEEIGHCRRYPPLPNGALPPVRPNDWCGEWHPERFYRG
jgi:hypothetical protein